jgi:UDP-N-acetyl-D-mannosaminuronate dehydrogenase
VPTLAHGASLLESVPFDQAVADRADCAVITTNHTAFDYTSIASLPLVVDTRNALAGDTRETIFRL